MPNKQNAIFTGANGGIARPLVKLFAKPGYRLLLTCREENREELISNVAEDNLKDSGAEIHMFFADMENEESLSTAANQMSLYMFDYLFNIAGALEPDDKPELIPEQKSAMAKMMMQVNFFGLMFFTECVLPFARPGATILNICSDANSQGRAHLIGYSGTKGALESATLSLRKKYEDGLKIYPVRVGWTRTKMGGLDQVNAMPPEYVAEQLYNIATGKVEAPDNTAIFGIGPVFWNESLPTFHALPYPEVLPTPYAL